MDLIFYGLCFVLLSLNMNGFDLMPDCVGYFLLYRGLGQLAGESKRFASICPVCLAMSVLTLPLMIANLSYGAGLAINLPLMLCLLYILRRLVQGFEELQAAYSTAHFDTDTLRVRWTLVATAQAVVYVTAAALPLHGNGLLSGLVWLGSMIVSVLFLMAFHRTRLAYRAAKN